jgi:hypothetical protein
METICRSLAVPGYRADSAQQATKEQCFMALATTFYGLGHSQKCLVYDGRRQYHQALKMVNRSMSNSHAHGTLDLLTSVVALCLHEVDNFLTCSLFHTDPFNLGYRTDTW